MNWFESFINILFPSKESDFRLDQIPTSPVVEHPIGTISCFDYHSAGGKKLLYYLKKRRDPKLSRRIAEHIYEYILEDISEQQQFSYFLKPIIIPVPISSQRHEERGFNQVSDAAKHLAKLLAGSYQPKLVIKHRETEKQALISQRHKRFENIRGCFQVPKDKRQYLENSDVIIIDDLVTTGATLSEISRILRKNKVRNIMLITIAH